MKNMKIRTKMLISFAIATVASILIGLCGYLNMNRLNNIINKTDFLIVQPLVCLNNITFDIGQIDSLIRDAVIANESDAQGALFDTIRDYQDDIRIQINKYLNSLDDGGYKNSEEYAVVSELSIRISEWSQEIDSVARLSANEQKEAAVERLHDTAIPKGLLINSLHEKLVLIHEEQAASSRHAARDNFILSAVLIIGLLVLVAAALIVLGTRISQNINQSVNTIVAATEAFADGNTSMDHVNLPDDEMGQIGRALKQVADNIAGLLADNYKVFTDAGAGLLNVRADAGIYKGDFHKILHGVNMTLQTFCRHLDAVPGVIAFFDPTGALVYGNKMMSRFLTRFGFDASGQALLAGILTAGESDQLPDKAAMVFSDTGPNDFTATIHINPGDQDESCFFRLSLHRVTNTENETLSCVMLTMVDITEIMSAKREAEQANRAKTEFLSHMSHEIRTPMNAILGMTQIASQSDNLEKIQDCVNKIENSSHHLLGILNDILDMSKIEAGKLTLSEEVTKLSENILFTISLMQSRAGGNHMEILHEIDITRDFVLADSMRFNQVFINLLSNAIKFSPEGGQIRVSAKETETDGDWSEYLFSVSDSGIGMSEEQTGRLFKSFEQADRSITKRFGGTGLGLAISKSIVEIMNGRIWVESEVGKGSAFFFTVRFQTVEPVGESDSRGDSSATEDNRAAFAVDLSNMRALLVDDIDINRIIVMEMLSSTGIEIEEAVNGHEAVALFENSPPDYFDLILMDIQMPEMDGYEAAKAIRAIRRSDAESISIIAMTANALKADVERAVAAGMNGHIAKPIDFHAALQTIQKYSKRKE